MSQVLRKYLHFDTIKGSFSCRVAESLFLIRICKSHAPPPTPRGHWNHSTVSLYNTADDCFKLQLSPLSNFRSQRLRPSCKGHRVSGWRSNAHPLQRLTCGCIRYSNPVLSAPTVSVLFATHKCSVHFKILIECRQVCGYESIICGAQILQVNKHFMGLQVAIAYRIYEKSNC